MKKLFRRIPVRLDTTIFVTLVLIAATVLVRTGILQPPYALALAATGIVIILALQFLSAGTPIIWNRQSLTRREGARDETSELAWLLVGRDNSITFGGRRYIKEVTARVLRTLGLDLFDPRDHSELTKLIGARHLDLLLDGQHPMTTADVQTLLDKLEPLTGEPTSKGTP